MYEWRIMPRGTACHDVREVSCDISCGSPHYAARACVFHGIRVSAAAVCCVNTGVVVRAGPCAGSRDCPRVAACVSCRDALH